MYRTYNARPLPTPPARVRSRKPLFGLLGIAVLAVAYVIFALLRPVPDVQVTVTPPVLPAQVKVNIPWPGGGAHEQSAFGADGYGLLAHSSSSSETAAETPAPTASVAKVITALAVLDKKPLKSGESGPTITLTDKDVALYNQYAAEDGSVVPVTAGETITEYQALQAMMLPSANNIADTLATWAFGSLPAYLTYATSYTHKLGMTSTTVTDASGFAPTTLSTASDLVRLGSAALANPVLADVVSQRTSNFPGYGPIYNVNALLGQSGIRGIKTGNTDQAGGVYLGAADITVAGKKVTVITAVMGAPDLPQALRGSLSLVQSAPAQFQNLQVVTAGQKVGRVTSSWGAASDIEASKAISVVAWSGTTVAPKSKTLAVHAPAKAGAIAGSLSLDFNGATQSSQLQLAHNVGKPGILWRLKHAL